MENNQNQFGQPIGFPVKDWKIPPFPPKTEMSGEWCRIEPLQIEKHAGQLFDAFTENRNDADWTYLPYGPFEKFDDFQSWLKKDCLGDDPLFHAIIDQKTNHAVGMVSFIRIVPKFGVIEVGHIHYSRLIQKTPIATEVMFLMMKRAFDELGYRRYEWKCDALNEPSKKSARRLGFQYEGIFRQAIIYKNRNRDTAWFSILDQEWPALREIFMQWLKLDNFDEFGKQIKRLSDFRK